MTLLGSGSARRHTGGEMFGYPEDSKPFTV
jgi:hypothetical protein